MPRRHPLTALTPTALTVATVLATALTAPATAGTSAAARDAQDARGVQAAGGGRAGGGGRAQGETWRADLSTVDSDDVGVLSNGRTVRLDPTAPTPAGTRTDTDTDTDEPAATGTPPGTGSGGERAGLLHLVPRHLGAPADTFTAVVRGDLPAGARVSVDVRGALDGGRWTEWVEAGGGSPAVLPAVVHTVQVRLTLTATGPGPAVDEVTLTSSPADRAPTTAERAGLVFRVFATREGLAGSTTANGHVIAERDHFAALPSRRGLSTKDTGSYTVQVCADNGRCEWAPVWDVGPWNTKDDHWNASADREMWQDLPQGKPEAQAAYQDAYNGGQDQFGRRVANPAGIDLADGTFWDGLALTENSWVTVTYVWTGPGPTAFVGTGTTGGAADVRDGPSVGAVPVGMAANHALVRIECRVVGEPVTGPQGTSDNWFRIAAGKFLPLVYLTDVQATADC